MDRSEETLLEPTQTRPTIQFPNIPGFIRDNKISGRLATSLIEEYHQILDNPKRLPKMFHPIIGHEREFSITGSRSYFNPSFYLVDKFDVPRKFYINLDAENCGVGAAGGLLIGLTTQQYFKTNGMIAQMASQFLSQKRLGSDSGSGIQKMIYSTGVMSRVVKRAFVGALLFDLLKRNAEMRRENDDWLNSGFAGFVSGAVFGLRGGLQTGALGAFGFSLVAILGSVLEANY